MVEHLQTVRDFQVVKLHELSGSDGEFVHFGLNKQLTTVLNESVAMPGITV